MYSLVCEGYTENTRRRFGGSDRTVDLVKSGITVRMDDIPSFFSDKLLVSAVMFYLRYKRMGLPYAGWGNVPNMLVEIVDTVEPLDRLYHPRKGLDLY